MKHDNKKVIENVISLFIPEGLELCAIDTVIRIGEGENKLFDCTNCIFKATNKLKHEGCPLRVGK